MDCNNVQPCNCTYPCPRHGKCCECVASHRVNGELPACYFPAEAEKTYNRSIEYYMQLKKEGKL
ncbi:MAG TPA: DUF6485 family protein [Candidatus Cloacimonadota bacterium]|jgi:hypothetical protein|nr:DUF6485 family protein [Candidatus Cloacimonadales bacterium]HPY95703.1 DUF6485 family protein [Candidatus Cloacimonadota bacterium]HQB40375.1 DUF6485 family protein [Candidatus Cloacimonadota bacterium]